MFGLAADDASNQRRFPKTRSEYLPPLNMDVAQPHMLCDRSSLQGRHVFSDKTLEDQKRVNGSTVDPPAVKQHMDPWGSQPRADGWLLRFEFTIYHI